MSGRVTSRNGSALLIVLGMLSFMVISAVAFSMFMRENRLPSSFLRQKLVANHLVKAGLANAMNEIDAAIGSYPYPGVTAGGGQSRSSGYYNSWESRVFTGRSSDSVSLESRTVPTLTLESLAYLPPPLMNTVRYWSRRTPTALWKPLKYDAGRYAYTAVNVSDYLDINRLRANVMRDSSPSNRVSLAYLFENDQHTGPASGASPEAFDKFMDAVRNDSDYKSRLVSLADYNLAIFRGKSKYGDIGFKSPFMEYFDGSGNGDGLFYGGVANAMDTVKRQQFITDSWYPGTPTNNVVYLSDEQPFDGVNESFYTLTKGNGSNTQSFKTLRKQMDGATLGALYDYVDEDDIPVSLAIPTIERAPMLTGLYVMTPKDDTFKLMLKTADKTIAQGEGKPKKIRRTWTIESLGDAKLSCSAHGVFPFKRSSGRNEKTSYTAQILVKAFFSDAALDFTKTRLTVLSLKPKNKNEWKADYAIANNQKAYMTEVTQGTATVKSASQRINDSDCVVSVDLSNGVQFNTSKLENLFVYGLLFAEGDEASGTYDSTAVSEDKLAPLCYYDRNGAIRTISQNGDPNIQLKLNFAIYVRLLDGNNTIDLVPAMLADDQIYNNFKSRDNNPSSFADDLCGDLEPVLPLSTATLLDASLPAFRSCAQNNVANPNLPAALSPLSLKIWCDDPRFNFAPEDWYVPQGDFSWSKWLEAARGRCDGADGRQTDIFQFVSNCGYLQSMGELQFLPNLDSDGGFYRYPNGGGPQDTDYYNASKYNGKPFADRTSTGDLANRAFAWRTHWAFGPDADWADGKAYSPYNWGILDARDGVVISPYSMSDELMMAGLANTPYDWTVAGLASEGEFDAKDVQEFCFNGYSKSEAPLDWADLKKVAANLRTSLANGQGWSRDLGGSGSTSDQWNDWWSSEGTILGVDADDIHDVDRKFLYSYWKSCFGDRQQLFLIFVRAEPTSMGAGVGKKLLRAPSQLGARAVALVWREPIASIKSSGSGESEIAPHRMRILFYHQFE